MGLTPRRIVPWTPRRLPNKWAWYRQGVGIVGSTNASRWNDSYGLGHDLLQATGANQPAIADGGLSLLFDGSAHVLKTITAPLASSCSVILFGRQITWTAGKYVTDGFNNDSLLIQQDTLTPQVRAFYGGSGGGNNSDWTLNAYAVLVAQFLTTGSGTIQVNQNAATTGSIGSSQTAAGFTLGARASQASSFSNIQIREAIVLSGALDAATIAKLYRYGQRNGLCV